MSSSESIMYVRSGTSVIPIQHSCFGPRALSEDSPQFFEIVHRFSPILVAGCELAAINYLLIRLDALIRGFH